MRLRVVRIIGTCDLALAALTALISCGDGQTGVDAGDAGPGGPPADGRLHGEPSSTARGAVGSWTAAATSEIDLNPLLSNMPTSTSRAIAVVAEEATIEDVNAALDAANVRIVGGVPSATLVVDIDEPGFERLRAAVESLQDSAAFIGAAEDTMLVTHVVPPDAAAADGWTWDDRPAGSNWGLEHLRVPAVWSLVQAVEIERCEPLSALVGAVDLGWEWHPDLPGTKASWVANGDEPDCSEDTVAKCRHGLGVAGIMAAGSPRPTDTGTEGVNPWASLTGRSVPEATLARSLAELDNEDRLEGEASRLLDQLSRLVRSDPSPPIVRG